MSARGSVTSSMQTDGKERVLGGGEREQRREGRRKRRDKTGTWLITMDDVVVRAC